MGPCSMPAQDFPGAPPAPPAGSSSRSTTVFRNLAILLLIGLLVAAWVLFTVDPGEGSWSLAGVVVGLVVAVGFLALVVLVLLLRLNHIQNLIRVVYPGAEQAAPERSARSKGFTRIQAEEEGAHVLTLEGIGPKYATRLNNHGIITIPQLLQADPRRLAQSIEATVELVEEWQAMGRLVQVKGIGPQVAEILALAGIDNARDLARSEVRELAARIDAIEDRRKTRVLGIDVTAGHVQQWVDAARRHISRR